METTLKKKKSERREKKSRAEQSRTLQSPSLFSVNTWQMNPRDHQKITTFTTMPKTHGTGHINFMYQIFTDYFTLCVKTELVLEEIK